MSTTDPVLTSSPPAPEFQEALGFAKDQHGRTLGELSWQSPILLVLLRHSGCTFCREALAALAGVREQIQAMGTQIVLVHMGDEEQSLGFFGRYGLGDLPRISDPSRRLYQALGLERGRLGQLMGPRVWLRGFRACILSGHGVGYPHGDVRQLPGAFLLHRGQILRAFRHSTSADRPDYVQLAKAPEQSER
jgi:peroxiredoxin